MQVDAGKTSQKQVSWQIRDKFPGLSSKTMTAHGGVLNLVIQDLA